VATTASKSEATIQAGTRVRTRLSNFNLDQPRFTTRIVRTYVNELGTTIYVMETGQFLGRGEFDVC
jgi:hypothetical protein